MRVSYAVRIPVRCSFPSINLSYRCSFGFPFVFLVPGISSGAVVSAALNIGYKLSQHTTHTPRMVVVLNDTARNYSTTLLSDEWLLENDLMDDLMAKKLEYLRNERYRAV